MKVVILVLNILVVVNCDNSTHVKNPVQYVTLLYNEVQKVNTGNFLISPLSLQNVFALLCIGARGETFRELNEVFCFNELKGNFQESSSLLSSNLITNENYTLTSANKVYIGNLFNVSDDFYKNITNIDAEIENVDFSAAEAVTEINNWVARKTNNKIETILAEAPFPDTKALLVNALFFQGKWLTTFEKVKTMPFYPNSKKAVYTEMMVVESYFNYRYDRKLKAKFLELFYEGDDISMTLVLPNDVDGLPALQEKLYETVRDQTYSTEFVQVAMPKFKIETTTYFVPILQNLGIRKAFSFDADFSGIGESNETININEVIQKTFIEVDEKGTTAAAATIVLLDRSAFGEDFTFVADHPFVFYLKHKIDGIFFIGRYVYPRQK